MARVLWPKIWQAGAAGLAALLALPVQPLQAQGLWQSLFGNGAPAPSRPAAGYGRQPAPGYSPYAPPASPFGSFFSPFQSQPRHDDPGAYDLGSYRTLCVRMCDGFYFPISHATTSAGLARDAERCAASCGGDSRLFYCPNPGGDIDTMLDLTGRAYASYPTAFKYRKTLVQGCQCRPQPWTEAERARHRAYAAAETAAPPAPVAAIDSAPAPARPRSVVRRVQSSQWDWLFNAGTSGPTRSPYIPYRAR